MQVQINGGNTAKIVKINDGDPITWRYTGADKQQAALVKAVGDEVLVEDHQNLPAGIYEVSYVWMDYYKELPPRFTMVIHTAIPVTETVNA